MAVVFKMTAIISAVSGRLFGSFDEMHRLFEFLVGRSVLVHELPEFKIIAEKKLLIMVPDIAQACRSLSGAGPRESIDLINDIVRKHGAVIALPVSAQ